MLVDGRPIYVRICVRARECIVSLSMCVCYYMFVCT